MLHGVRDPLAKAVEVEMQEHHVRILRGGPIIPHTPVLEAWGQRGDKLAAIIDASRHVLGDLKGKYAQHSRMCTAQCHAHISASWHLLGRCARAVLKVEA